MKLKEWEKASLFQVIDRTLLEYLEGCLQAGGKKKDRCRYIGQILSKLPKEVWEKACQPPES